MIVSCQLPFQFDPQALQADLARVPSEMWVPHFNKGVYEGEWGGVALRSVAGSPMPLYPDPAAEGRFEDTALVAECPTFRQILASFQCELESARLLKLAVGARIREHRDYKLALEDGVMRVHVPVVTNPDVAFVLNGERVVMAAGEMWYLNLNLPHSVTNNGTTERVHLVIDAVVNDWARSLVAEAASV